MRHRLSKVPRRLLGITAALGLGYLVLAGMAFSLRPEHFAVVLGMMFAVLWNDRTREFLRGFYPILIAAFIYDASRLARPLLQHLSVHVAEPYAFDKTLFGISSPTGILTPNEYLAPHHAPWLDVITGWAYILYMYVPLAFVIYLLLFARHEAGRSLLSRFGWTFLALNVLGVITYYLYPAAPPWYAAKYGFGPVDLATPPDPAGAIRWDEIMGVNYFKNFYARGASVFGAIPSLHGALPLITFLYLRQLRKPIASALCFAFFLLVCFSAVYLQHHYILDLMVGSAYVLLCYGVEVVVSRFRSGSGKAGAAATDAAGTDASAPLAAAAPGAPR